MITAGRVYHFRATHYLPNFPDPWCHEHEHDYRVKVTIGGGGDMEALDEAWEMFVSRLPRCLNAAYKDTTVEGLAARILQDFAPRGAVRVEVWEDDSRWGEATV